MNQGNVMTRMPNLDPMDFMQAQQNELKELRRKLAAEKTNERLTAMQASAKVKFRYW